MIFSGFSASNHNRTMVDELLSGTFNTSHKKEKLWLMGNLEVKNRNGKKFGLFFLVVCDLMSSFST